MLRKICFVAAASIAITASAKAHPGPKLITTGSANAPAATTGGVGFEEVNGVHLFRGRTALLGDEPAAMQTPEESSTIVKVVVIDRPYRSFRRLRSQGFYSGVAYPSRRYTQGFYSGR